MLTVGPIAAFADLTAESSADLGRIKEEEVRMVNRVMKERKGEERSES